MKGEQQQQRYDKDQPPGKDMKKAFRFIRIPVLNQEAGPNKS
jgi:hypothetical protein